jgi:hypothetical protein
MAEYDDRADDLDDRPRRRRDEDDGGDRGDIRRTIENAKGMVKGPAIGLIVTGVLAIILSLVSLLGVSGIPEGIEAERKKIDTNTDMPADQKKMSKDILDFYEKYLPTIVIGSGILGIGGGALTILGGVRMMGLKSAGLTKTGAILSMIPCTGACCPLGLGFGIWAIMVLGKPDVKEAYRAIARGNVEERD